MSRSVSQQLQVDTPGALHTRVWHMAGWRYSREMMCRRLSFTGTRLYRVAKRYSMCALLREGGGPCAVALWPRGLLRCLRGNSSLSALSYSEVPHLQRDAWLHCEGGPANQGRKMWQGSGRFCRPCRALQRECRTEPVERFSESGVQWVGSVPDLSTGEWGSFW